MADQVSERKYEKTTEGYPAYAIFFDNVRVDKYITSWQTNVGTSIGMGSASFNMIYTPYFYQFDDEQGNTAFTSKDGVENMTVVRIFSKNMFSGRYHQIFEGNIRGKSRTKTKNGYNISFVATDYMTWLNRTIVPLAVTFSTETMDIVDRLRWNAQGVDTQNLATIVNNEDITFVGKTIQQFINNLKVKTMQNNKLYSASNTVAQWDEPMNRIQVMGDIDPELVKAQVVDFILNTGSTSINSMYVAINDMVSNLMFEFFQDVDGIIRVKPPFWNEGVLRNHILDSQVILSFNENTNYDNLVTRTVVVGNTEEWEGGVRNQLLVPAVAYVGDLEDYKNGYYVGNLGSGNAGYNVDNISENVEKTQDYDAAEYRDYGSSAPQRVNYPEYRDHTRIL